MSNQTQHKQAEMKFQEVADLLKVRRNKLTEFLRNQGVLEKDRPLCAKNTPVCSYRDQGYFVVKLKPIKRMNKVHPQTLVTAKGLMFIKDPLDANPEAAKGIRRRNLRPAHQSSSQTSTQPGAETPAGAH